MSHFLVDVMKTVPKVQHFSDFGMESWFWSGKLVLEWKVGFGVESFFFFGPIVLFLRTGSRLFPLVHGRPFPACSRPVPGCSRLFPACSRLVPGCSRLFPACFRLFLACSRLVPACSRLEIQNFGNIRFCSHDAGRFGNIFFFFDA